MRQAILAFDEETVAEWGFEPFLDAGLLDADILSCEGSRGVTRLHVEERVDPERLDELDVVRQWELVAERDDEYVYVIEADASDSPEADRLDPDELTRMEDVSVHDDGFTITSVGSQERIGKMLERLQEAGIEADLRQLGGYRVDSDPLDCLTDRQREVLSAAYEAGYYDVPRRSSAAEVAAELDLDDSTVSEHLQRAERNLVGAVLDHAAG